MLNCKLMRAFIMSIIIIGCLGACSPEHSSYSDYYAIDEKKGWLINTPFEFEPVYNDSLAQYDISVSLRHNSQMKYQKINLVADFIISDGKFVRKNLTFNLSVKTGRWNGKGFGAIFQQEQVAISHIPAHKFKKVVIWQNNDGCDTLHDITNIGIILTKCH